MKEIRIDSSPGALARFGGVLYLIIIAGGLFGEGFIRNGLAGSDAAKTAANIHAHELLWRSGIAGEFFMLVCTVCLALILLILLRPVSRDLAWLAIFFNLVSVAVEAVNEQKLLAAMFPLGSADYLAAFEPAQLHAMMSLSLKSYSYGFGISLIFFGCECVILGYLIIKSEYLPKTVGVLMQIAGFCYLVNSFAMLVAPKISNLIFPAILIPPFVGELSLCLWLLVKGVNNETWNRRQADRNASPDAREITA